MIYVRVYYETVKGRILKMTKNIWVCIKRNGQRERERNSTC